MKIGRRAIGQGNPVYFIAEAGSNHDGDLSRAMRLIEVAAEAGADAVKFQTFRADALYPRSAGTTEYLEIDRPIHDVIHDLEMPWDWIPVLAAHCAEQGIDFLSTPFDEASADALDPFVSAFKIASYEMTHHVLLQHCARKGKPVILSTGTATLSEVREAVEALRAVGGTDIVVLQCTAKYPAPLETLNLLTLPVMARELGVPVGLSDHSREPTPGPMAAAALGAAVIEKHFTLDNRLPGPDHAYALEPSELAAVVARVRQVERTLGSGEKRPAPEENELRTFARRTVFTTRPLAAGDPFGVGNLAVLRCGKLGYGLHPREYVRTLGHVARRALPAEASVTADDVGELRARSGEVALRPLDRDDTDRVVRWRSRTDVGGQLFSDGPPTPEAHLAWFRTLQLRTDRLEFVILDRGEPVGTTGLSGIDLGAREAEYGILLGEPSARGHGVAAAASHLILDLAFEALALERVRLALFSDNTSARRLYDRLGFQPARPAAPRMKNGRLRDVTGMTLDRGTWLRTRRTN